MAQNVRAFTTQKHLVQIELRLWSLEFSAFKSANKKAQRAQRPPKLRRELMRNVERTDVQSTKAESFEVEPKPQYPK